MYIIFWNAVELVDLMSNIWQHCPVQHFYANFILIRNFAKSVDDQKSNALSLIHLELTDRILMKKEMTPNSQLTSLASNFDANHMLRNSPWFREKAKGVSSQLSNTINFYTFHWRKLKKKLQCFTIIHDFVRHCSMKQFIVWNIGDLIMPTNGDTWW